MSGQGRRQNAKGKVGAGPFSPEPTATVDRAGVPARLHHDDTTYDGMKDDPQITQIDAD
jgi:hypothetical protein